MADIQQWIIGECQGLRERGHPLLGTSPLELQNAQSLTEGALEMRQGFQTESLTGSGLTGPVLWVGRHVTNDGVEEMWAAANNSGTAALARRVAGSWSSVSFSDTAAAADLLYMQGVTMNGKFFLFYNSDQNRLHLWDGTSVRRVGLARASVVTAATMGGAGLTFNRWYRKRVVVIENSVVVRRSEPSPTFVNVSITDDAGVTVTRGTVPGEGETHWEVEASNDSGGAPTIWYRIATVAIGTLTSNDTNSSITSFEISDQLGLYVPPPSAKYGSTDGLTLIMGGAWETSGSAGQTTPKQNRAWFTRPLGASDVSDDESIPDTSTQKNWLDIGDGGPITAVEGPMYGETVVLKEHAIAKLTPTGNLETPYALTILNESVGCVDARLAARGEIAGAPALLFADLNQVYAFSTGGVMSISEQIGRDLRALTLSADAGLLLFDPFQRVAFLQASVAPAAQAGSYSSWLLDCAKQRWGGFALGGATTGWLLNTSLLGTNTNLGGNGAEIRNGAFAVSTEGTQRMYVCGQNAAGAGVIQSWGNQVALDGSDTYLTIGRYRKVLRPGFLCTVMNPTVFYRNPQGTTAGTLTLTLTYIRDFDEQRQQSKTLTMTDDDNGIAVRQVTFEGLMQADVSTLDVRAQLSYSGTAYASQVTPAIDAIVVPWKTQEPLTR